MALSLDEIHKPFNDFFLTHFKSDPGGLVQFRFDKFGSIIADDDYKDRQHPEVGYSPAAAKEKFSDLVNYVPMEQPDGISLTFAMSSIDQTYFRIYKPAVPVIPAGADATTRDSIIKAFGYLKQQADELWDTIRLESNEGLILAYKPSLAAPATWYDKSAAQNWTTQSFQVTAPGGGTVPPTAPQAQWWRMQVSNAAMHSMVLKVEANPGGVHVAPTQPGGVHVAATHAGHAVAAHTAAAHPAGHAVAAHTGAHVTIRTHGPATPATLHHQLAGLDINKRLQLRALVAARAKTKPVEADHLSLTFEYCLVKIHRPWMSDALLNDKSWCIPGTPKGALTRPDNSGGTLTLLPIAAVVIRKLSIEANWSAADVNAAKKATDFGPFKVSGEIVNNKLTHEGMQVVGWLVQRMSDLPPNDPS